MPKRKAPTIEEIRAANAKHDAQYSKDDRMYSKQVYNNIFTIDGPRMDANAGQPMRAHLGMTTQPTVGNWWKWK